MTRRVLVRVCAVAAVAALAGGIWWVTRDEEPRIVLTSVQDYADTVLCPEDPEYLSDEPLVFEVDDLEAYEEFSAQVIRTLERIEPPPELQDFHEVYIDSFRPEVDYRALWDETEPRIRNEALTELENICNARRGRETDEGNSGAGGG